MKWENPEIKEGKLTKYNWLVQGTGGLNLGKYTDIGAFTYINAKYGVLIENYVQIGSHCSIYSESTIDNKKSKVILKENCKIGSHSVVMPGVTIGKNSIIGAMSFVNINVPDDYLAFGSPIKLIRKLNKLEKSKRIF